MLSKAELPFDDIHLSIVEDTHPFSVPASIPSRFRSTKVRDNETKIL